MGFPPLLVASAIFIEQHSEANAGFLITFVTQSVQPLALPFGAVLRLNGQAAKQSGAANDDR